MTDYQSFQLTVCYMLALVLCTALVLMDIQMLIGYIKKKLKKRKEARDEVAQDQNKLA